jgi:formate--tetrahydrofolate ligase
VLDVNDRSLRFVVTGLNGSSNGIPTETGFDITPASEIMAILCLSTSLEDLRNRIDRILVGYTYENKPLYVKDLGFGGALVALLKDAIKPNLVQTTEKGAAFVHGGPFANIAHGCNSIMATKAAMQFGEYAITEAGFGSDLGGEKFLNIKCRAAGIAPKAAVLVTTTQSIKLHGKVDEKFIRQPNIKGLKAGIKNVERHIQNLQQFGLPVIVALNRFGFDTDEEVNFIADWCKKNGTDFAINEGFAKGGEGAIALAHKVVEVVENKPCTGIVYTYELNQSIKEKVQAIVTNVYKGKAVTYGRNASAAIKKIEEMGAGNLPVCIAKTPYSFTDDASKIGAAEDFSIHIENIVLNNGAGFIVAVAGEILRMPGLPKEPSALHIDVVNGEITGIS